MIHFFTQYSRAINSGKTVEEAISKTMRECGDALTLTTIVLIVGFSTMLLSSFLPNYLMGVLAVSMIALAWLADFIVTPAMLALIDAQANEVLPVFDTSNAEVYGRQLIEYSDKKLHGWKDEVVLGEMHLYDKNGASVLRSFRRIGLERFGQGDKFIIKFTFPADVKGGGALRHVFAQVAPRSKA